MKPLKIVEVTHLDDYKLSIKFDDGKLSTVDFEPFLNSSQHPQIKKYKKLENFLKYEIENGDLQWNDYELCFPIYDLYTNDILKSSCKTEERLAS